jgi:hypothetical protein
MKTAYRHGIYPVFRITRIKELIFSGARLERFTLMNPMAVTDDIVDPIFFERLGNFRQFLEQSLSEIVNREVKILPRSRRLFYGINYGLKSKSETRRNPIRL